MIKSTQVLNSSVLSSNALATNYAVEGIHDTDTIAPTVIITLSDYAFKTGDTATVTFTFSEAPTSFAEADVTAPNGALSAFTATGDPLVYTATFTPTASVSDATNVITVGTSWTDAAGNPPAGATTSDNYTVDTAAPTVAITSSESSPSSANPIPMTFTLSEVSTNFAIGDITTGAAGTLGNFAGSGTSYTADLTVTTAGATITIDVAGGVFTDAAGNGNTAATQFSITSSIVLLDMFTTADASPITSPRNCEPGPGTVTTTDAANNCSIAGGLYAIGTSGSDASRGFFSDALALAAGRGHFVNVINYAGGPVLKLGTAFDNDAGGNMQPGGFLKDPGGNVGNIVSGTGKYGFVRTTSGHIYYIKDNKLVWVYPTAVAGTWGLSARCYFGAGTSISMDNLAIVNMQAPWQADYGIATSRSATSTNGQTKTHEANAIVEHKTTAAAGVTQELMFRRIDDDNCWIVRCDQAGSRVYLYEKNAGVETEKGATGGVAQTFTAGVKYRITAVFDGTTIYIVVASVLKITATSQTFNQTETGAKVSHAGEEFIAWPRDLSGAALSEVQRAYPF